jgi:hypothetical protein
VRRPSTLSTTAADAAETAAIVIPPPKSSWSIRKSLRQRYCNRPRFLRVIVECRSLFPARRRQVPPFRDIEKSGRRVFCFDPSECCKQIRSVQKLEFD